MTKPLSDEAKAALNLLSQRLHPSNIFWLTRSWTNGKNWNKTTTCNICGAQFSNEDVVAGSPIWDHGIQHLKERNLLPFL